MTKLISIIFIIFIYGINIPHAMAALPPVAKDMSGGWVFKDKNGFYHFPPAKNLPSPKIIPYRIEGDLGYGSYFTDKIVKELLKEAMMKVAEVANLKFVPINKTSSVVIKKVSASLMGGGFVAVCKKEIKYRTDECTEYKSTGAILFNKDMPINSILDPELRVYGKKADKLNKYIIIRHIFMHELGHLLGLSHVLTHPLSENILPSYQLDRRASSVMFATLVIAQSHGVAWADVSRYSRADRAALIKLYGASPVFTSYLANNTAKATALRDEL